MDPNLAIQVSQVSKRYRIGGLYSYDTLRDVLSSSAHAFARRFRRAVPDAAGAAVGGASPDYIWALKDVSFSVERGEVLGIVGHNGAGKTILLKVLSRVTDPTEGRAEIRGRIGSLLEVGTGFHQELSGRENVYLSGAILGMKRAEIDRKFDEIVSFAEFEKFIDTPVKRYSSGMQVRLGFAVAAHLETEILLVDEVLAVGDTAFQKKSLAKMRQITREGRTILVVSHNMALIQGICSRALLLSQGRITRQGDARYVVEQYLKSVSERPSERGPLASSHDGRVSLQALEIVDDQGHILDSVVSGQTFTIRTVWKCRDSPGEVAIDIGLDDGAGRRVAVLSNLLVDQSVRLDASTNAILCRIPEVPLAPGEYTLTVHLVGPNDLDVSCPNAAALRVESGDFFHSGKMVEAWWVGSTLIRHEWAVERGNGSAWSGGSAFSRTQG